MITSMRSVVVLPGIRILEGSAKLHVLVERSIVGGILSKRRVYGLVGKVLMVLSKAKLMLFLDF